MNYAAIQKDLAAAKVCLSISLIVIVLAAAIGVLGWVLEGSWSAITLSRLVGGQVTANTRHVWLALGTVPAAAALFGLGLCCGTFFMLKWMMADLKMADHDYGATPTPPSSNVRPK